MNPPLASMTASRWPLNRPKFFVTVSRHRPLKVLLILALSSSFVQLDMLVPRSTAPPPDKEVSWFAVMQIGRPNVRASVVKVLRQSGLEFLADKAGHLVLPHVESPWSYLAERGLHSEDGCSHRCSDWDPQGRHEVTLLFWELIFCSFKKFFSSEKNHNLFGSSGCFNLISFLMCFSRFSRIALDRNCFVLLHLAWKVAKVLMHQKPDEHLSLL